MTKDSMSTDGVFKRRNTVFSGQFPMFLALNFLLGGGLLAGCTEEKKEGAKTPVVSTFAGSERCGYRDGTGTDARFYGPSGIAVDRAGNLYVADSEEDSMPDNIKGRIGKISPAGEVSTFVGSAYEDGTGADLGVLLPRGIHIDASDNLYVTDADRIRKITPTGEISTLAGDNSFRYRDGTGAEAWFASPSGIALDRAGNLYVADSHNHRIRKITPAGEVSTFAGGGTCQPTTNPECTSTGNPEDTYRDGTGAEARFKFPKGIAMDASGNLYVADSGNNRIRKITPAGEVSTFAGDGTDGYRDGTGAEAQFDWPNDIAIDRAGNLYVADTVNRRIRKLTPAGEVSTLAGDGTRDYRDGTGTEAQFERPIGIALDGAGDLYVADGCLIRKITFE